MLIGVISDTHGLLRPEAVEALCGSDAIIHAGDVGDPEILEKLSKIAPVTAVRGNVDTESWARKLPKTNVLEIAGVSIYVLHNIDQLDLKPKTAGFAAVIYGHSHVPNQETKHGVLYFNPGQRRTEEVPTARVLGEADRERSKRDGRIHPALPRVSGCKSTVIT